LDWLGMSGEEIDSLLTTGIVLYDPDWHI